MRVYLLHGWDGVPEAGIRPWLKRELEAKGHEVIVPALPESETPNKDKWLSALREACPNPDKQTILVGHSMGGQLALRFLQELPAGIQIRKLVLVAPVIDQITGMEEPEEFEVAVSWLGNPIDWDAVKNHASEIVGVFSDDDPYIPLSSATLLKEKTGADIRILTGKGHFGDTEMTESVDVLQAI